MRRREFLAGVSVAGIAGLGGAAMAAGGGDREYFELRRYRLLGGAKKNMLGDFLRDVGIPAMNRIGIGPVGAFTAKYGPSDPTLYVLMVHKNLESVVTAAARLLADDEFGKSDLVNASSGDAGYVRAESSLMAAFKNMPKLEVPPKRPRIFELRTYESHSIKAAKKKIEMFNEGGEIAIFNKTGLNPVFFGETIIGPMMPNLTYMLCFDDLTDRDKRWGAFGSSDEWKKLSSDPQYKDTVSNITDIILQPTGYSQI
ncbi:MAG: NIPSNAP family protein [Sedimentisphaerales bacterium]|nr:NIPSNAP family protein [Sedimentisphaerales bacterium]